MHSFCFTRCLIRQWMIMGILYKLEYTGIGFWNTKSFFIIYELFLFTSKLDFGAHARATCRHKGVRLLTVLLQGKLASLSHLIIFWAWLCKYRKMLQWVIACTQQKFYKVEHFKIPFEVDIFHDSRFIKAILQSAPRIHKVHIWLTGRRASTLICQIYVKLQARCMVAWFNMWLD